MALYIEDKVPLEGRVWKPHRPRWNNGHWNFKRLKGKWTNSKPKAPPPRITKQQQSLKPLSKGRQFDDIYGGGIQ